MSQQQSSTDQQQPPPIYTEEEQHQRWTLIVQALLSALGPELPKHNWKIESSTAREPVQPA